MKEIIYFSPSGISDTAPIEKDYVIIKKPLFHKLNDNEIYELISQINSIITSDISFKSFLYQIIQAETNKKIRWVLANLYYAIEVENKDLADALEFTEAFPSFVVSSLKAKSGAVIKDILDETREYYLKKHEFKKKVREQLLPSMITLIFAIVLIFAALFYLLPSLFKQFQESFGSVISPENMPYITRLLLKLTNPIISFSILGIFIFIGVIILNTIIKYQNGKFPSLDYLILKIPFLNKIILYSNFFEFFTILNFFRKTGNIIDGILEYKNIAISGIIKELIEHLNKSLNEGEDFYYSIGTYQYTPKQISSILISSKLGINEAFLIEYCQGKLKNELEKSYVKFSTFMGFFPVLVVGVIVLILIIGIYLGPITTLMSQIGEPSGAGMSGLP